MHAREFEAESLWKADSFQEFLGSWVRATFATPPAASLRWTSCEPGQTGEAWVFDKKSVRRPSAVDLGETRGPPPASVDVSVGDRLVGRIESASPIPPIAAEKLLHLGLAWEHFFLREKIDALTARIARDVAYHRDETRAERNLRSLTGDSSEMKKVRLAIQQTATADCTVLILGETGTGKELVARAIHQLSPRHDHQLVGVNCAALSSSVIHSELFGHEAGAFTGAAKRRLGRFELAHGGTIFLDEIAEMPAETQVMLLRVLQERTFERVGGNQPIPMNVRVISATHRDLEMESLEGRFRRDLFYRINVFPIRMPALRDRREDIPDLARHFVATFARRMNKTLDRIDHESLRRLQAYAWPGNVRELENLMERAVIVETTNTLRIDPQWLRSPSVSSPDSSTLADAERTAILRALEQTAGKIYGSSGAASVLGMKPSTLYGKMKKLGIPRFGE